MADRRMVHKKVVESDSFYKLSEGAQSIYMHLTANADDDGFVNNAESIAMRFKSGPKKLAELVSKRFVLKFGEVYVIKHWRIGNSLKSDRSKPPTYPGIAASIWIKANRAYTDHPVDGCRTLLEVKTGIHLESKRNPDGIHLESQQNRTELKGTELKGTEPNRTPQDDFEKLWDEYPEMRRGSRVQAWEIYRIEITSPEDADMAFDSLESWKCSEQWNKDGGQYVPNFCNWLERGIWRSKPTKLVRSMPRELDEDDVRAIKRMLAENSEEVDNV